MRSNRVARRHPGQKHSHNGPWTYECCFEVVHAGSGLRNCMIVSVMFIGNEISNDMVVECSQGPTHVFWEQKELDRDKLLDKT